MYTCLGIVIRKKEIITRFFTNAKKQFSYNVICLHENFQMVIYSLMYTCIHTHIRKHLVTSIEIRLCIRFLRQTPVGDCTSSDDVPEAWSLSPSDPIFRFSWTISVSWNETSFIFKEMHHTLLYHNLLSLQIRYRQPTHKNHSIKFFTFWLLCVANRSKCNSDVLKQ